MQNDEMIWQVINHQFCSYKANIARSKSDKTQFCQHPYSVTGLCNRTSCPLANSLYATLREEDGKVYLCMKTVERAHSPKNLWEKVLLSRNYSKALHQLDEHLQYFPKVLLHRNKQRLTKIHQYLIRMRKLKLKELAGHKAKIVQAPTRKVAQREARREQKALVAAKITQKVEQELVDRLAKGTYGDIYNFPEMSYKKALNQLEDEEDNEQLEETEDESEEEDSIVEYVEDLESDEEMEDSDEEVDMEDMDYLGDNQWGKGDDDSSSSGAADDDGDGDSSDGADDRKNKDDDDSDEDSEDGKRPPKKARKRQTRRKGPRVEIEYEEENEAERLQEAAEMAW